MLTKETTPADRLHKEAVPAGLSIPKRHIHEECGVFGLYSESPASVASLGYLSPNDVVELADNTECGFCTACFGGGCPTAIPRDGGRDRFACKISERKREQHA